MLNSLRRRFAFKGKTDFASRDIFVDEKKLLIKFYRFATSNDLDVIDKFEHWNMHEFWSRFHSSISDAFVALGDHWCFGRRNSNQSALRFDNSSRYKNNILIHFDMNTHIAYSRSDHGHSSTFELEPVYAYLTWSPFRGIAIKSYLKQQQQQKLLSIKPFTRPQKIVSHFFSSFFFHRMIVIGIESCVEYYLTVEVTCKAFEKHLTMQILNI